jgi:hypothetical protein
MRLKPKYLIIPVAAASLIFFMYQIFNSIELPARENKRLASDGRAKIMSEEDSDDRNSLSKEIQGEINTSKPWSDFVYPVDSGIRDPFQQNSADNEPPVEIAQNNSVILTGIVYSDQDPIAIFDDGNGQTYLIRESEKILDFKVEKILPRSALIDRNGEKIKLEVFDDSRPYKSESQTPNKQELAYVDEETEKKPEVQPKAQISKTSRRNMDKKEPRRYNRDRVKVDVRGLMHGNSAQEDIIPGLEKRVNSLLNSRNGR